MNPAAYAELHARRCLAWRSLPPHCRRAHARALGALGLEKWRQTHPLARVLAAKGVG